MLFNCVLCGISVFCGDQGSDNPWDTQFRVLFGATYDPSVSGVGLNVGLDYGYFPFPFEYDKRWDDPGYSFWSSDSLPVMQQLPSNGRHGYVFHFACWSLLEKFFHPEQVPLRTLMNILKSCPFKLGRFNIDPNIQELVDLRSTFPWNESRLGEKAGHIRRADPFNIPELETTLLQWQLGEIRKHEVNSPEEGSSSAHNNKRLSSSLTRLAPEILTQIMSYLETEDVKNISRTPEGLVTMNPFLLDQSFWASRFQYPFEFDFIFEAQNYGKGQDWRTLYFRVSKLLRSSPGLQNRKRIWTLVRERVSPLTRLHYGRGLESDSIRRYRRKQLTWNEVHANLRPPQQVSKGVRYSHGYNELYQQYLEIPATLRRVTVFTVVKHEPGYDPDENTYFTQPLTYIIGMSFISSEGSVTRLGYTLAADETAPNITEQHADVTVIQGFKFSIGELGIHALKLVTEGEQLSQWFGNPDHGRHVDGTGSIVALVAIFDAFKMVSLRYGSLPNSDSWSLDDMAGMFGDQI